MITTFVAFAIAASDAASAASAITSGRSAGAPISLTHLLQLRLAAPRHRPAHIAPDAIGRQHVLGHEPAGEPGRAVHDHVERPSRRVGHAHPLAQGAQPSARAPRTATVPTIRVDNGSTQQLAHAAGCAACASAPVRKRGVLRHRASAAPTWRAAPNQTSAPPDAGRQLNTHRARAILLARKIPLPECGCWASNPMRQWNPIVRLTVTSWATEVGG